MSILKCVYYITIFIVIIVFFTYNICKKYNDNDGFRNKEQKIKIAKKIIDSGKPDRDAFRSNSLDGVEYYDAKQLWRHNKFDIEHVQKIL
jgi:uncharacterized membrane protein